MNNKELEALKLQSIDPLAEAEVLTGKSYKEDKSTESLGFTMHIMKNQALASLLDEIGDTKFSENELNYVDKLSKFGFEVVLKEPFQNTHYKNIIEHLYILFNKELGVLIKFDTFGYEGSEPHNVNGGNIYYNWAANDFNRNGCTSSGNMIHHKFDNCLFNSNLTPHEIDRNILSEKPKWEEDMKYEEYRALDDEWSKNYNSYKTFNNLRYVWSGSHDCREAAISNVKRLIEDGILLNKWIECPFYWLLNFSEYGKNENHDKFDKRARKITKERISKLPDYVQECIGEYK